MLTFGSLFAGAGGFDLGCESAGWHCRWQVENDRHATSVLQRNWPSVKKYGDIRSVVGGESIGTADTTTAEALEPVDVITYGFPCQDLSVAGKRAGLDGERSGLFFEAIRIISEMREATDGKQPRIAVAENVPGLLNANRGAAMGQCLDALAEIGAVAIEWRVLDAQFFGVPQRRSRVFIVAIFDSRAADCGQVFPEPSSLCRDLAARREQDGDNTASVTESPSIGIATTGTLTAGAHPGTYNGQDAYSDLLLPWSHEGRIEVRSMSPLEWERLQGWPDNHTLYGSDGKKMSDAARRRMIANGVSAPVAKYVADCIGAIL